MFDEKYKSRTPLRDDDDDDDDVFLFILQVIYEHGVPWWNNIDKGTLLIRPPQLSGNPTSRSI
jgi:hypothetical protein